MRIRAGGVGSDESVVHVGVGGGDLVEYEGGVAEAAGVGEGAEGEEFADGEVVEVEAVGGFEGAHGGAALG